MFSCFAVITPGLEAPVLGEFRELGMSDAVVEEGGLGVEASFEQLMRLNLWSRTASRILVRVGSFRAAHLSELEREVKRLPWEAFLSPGTPVCISATCKKSKIYHSGAASERTLRGIERKIGGTLKLVAPKDAGRQCQRVLVRLVRNQCVVSIDSGGEHLHRRGYKRDVVKAPLRENLAAACLRVLGWPNAGRLYDPMTGSGTIAIEAAMMASNRAPGMLRTFAFQNWPAFEEASWTALLDEARSVIGKEEVPPIYGFDRDAGAIQAARENALRAGVAEHVSFKQASLSESAASVDGEHGLLFCNPPYGQRIGESKALRNLYSSLGQILNGRFATWDAGVMAADRKLVRGMDSGMKPIMPPMDHGGTRVSLYGRRLEPVVDKA